MKKYCLTLDLKEDAALIAAYEDHHQKVWPEIIQSITGSGIIQLQIYRLGNRLVMLLDAKDTFSFEEKAKLDATNNKVQEWENLMWQYQQALPLAKPGQKWVLMTKIFDLQKSI